jgi:hypothetical protein
MSPQTRERGEIQTLQEIIDLMASGRISEEEGRRRFEELWQLSEQDSMMRRLLRSLFPSLSREST